MVSTNNMQKNNVMTNNYHLFESTDIKLGSIYFHLLNHFKCGFLYTCSIISCQNGFLLYIVKGIKHFQSSFLFLREGCWRLNPRAFQILSTSSTTEQQPQRPQSLNPYLRIAARCFSTHYS
jgi:hypothetical protein